MPTVDFKTARETYDMMKVHFESPEMQKGLILCAQKTLKLLLKNEVSCSPNGEIRLGKGWWHPCQTDDPVLIKTRLLKLPHAAYEHGMILFLYLLEKNGILRMDDDLWERAVHAESVAIWNELESYSAASHMSSWVSTEDLRMLFGNGQRKMETIRSHLVQLSTLGICTVRYNAGYSVKIGPVGKIFFEEVYLPITDKMSLTQEV